MHAMDEKGHGWLASRASATSLAPSPTYAPFDGETFDDDRKTEAAVRSMPLLSGHASRVPSRVPSKAASRVGSRAGSRVDLSMTRGSQVQMSLSSAVEDVPVGQGMEDMEPDFVDLDEEEEEEEEEGVQGEVDESEMRRLVWGRVGGWVDWLVGWMDLREERLDDDEEGDDGGGEVHEVQPGGKDEGTMGAEKEERLVGIEAPVMGGVWEDARWLVKIAGRSF